MNEAYAKTCKKTGYEVVKSRDIFRQPETSDEEVSLSLGEESSVQASAPANPDTNRSEAEESTTEVKQAPIKETEQIDQTATVAETVSTGVVETITTTVQNAIDRCIVQ